MKGQRLFVRAIEAADHDAVQAFLDQQRSAAPAGPGEPGRILPPACGLLGKILGDLVAVLAMQITADAVVVDHIVVASDLRRKRIGRVMLAELEKIAAKIDRRRLLVRGTDDGPAEFLRRVGFEREGPWWIRRVGN